MSRLKIDDLPILQDLSTAEAKGLFGGLRRPIKKATIRYVVDPVNHGASRVTAITAKKNILTMKNLPPGNYTASYNVRMPVGDKRVSRPPGGLPTGFTIH